MKTKKILLATNLSITHFAVLLANMLSEGLKGIEIYPEFASEPSDENVCIVAYVGKLPQEIFDFIKKHEGTEIIIYLDHEAAQSHENLMERLDGFTIRDEPIQVVGEVWDMLKFLQTQK